MFWNDCYANNNCSCGANLCSCACNGCYDGIFDIIKVAISILVALFLYNTLIGESIA